MGIKEIKQVPMPIGKRVFDVVAAGILIIIFSPIFFIILLSIFIEHFFRGKIFAHLFYKEIRISQGKPFNFIKFNVFKPEVIKEMKSRGEFIHTKKLEHDHKSLSTSGGIIQRIYFDELPQLFNVIKGDMSMVGPRPVNQVNYKMILERGITTKTEIKAGLTGRYQAHKGEKGVIQDKLDREYINFCKDQPSWKIILRDLKIIFKTVIILFKAKGI